MSLTIEQLAEEALALPANTRAQLIDRLVESLDPVEDISFRQLWATEALRRRDEVRSGRVQTIPGEEAIKLAREAASE
jgi:putative addiction module component (TIGR02574 family)